MKNLNQISLKAFLIMCLFIVGCNNLSIAQQNYLSKSNAHLSTLNNEVVKASHILEKGKNIVVFWKSYNDEHATYIQEIIDVTNAENIKVIAICNDDQGTFKHINPMVAKRNWDIDVYIDKEKTLNKYVNSEQSLLTLVFENHKLVKQFYGNKDAVDTSFFDNRYGSIILN